MGRTNSSKHIICIIGTIGFAVVFYLCSIFLKQVLYDNITPMGDIAIEDWILKFYPFLLAGLGITVFFTIIRYVFEQWVIKFRPNSARMRWVVWFVLVVAVSVAISIYTSQTLPLYEGEWLIYACCAIVTVVPFYLITLFFSPSSVKYVVPPSRHVRVFY